MKEKDAKINLLKIPNLEGKINEHTVQMNEKANQSDLANSNAMPLLNAYGNYENIHPKVIKLETAINGYIYWMAYTPYPSGSIDEENPSIACSENAIDWITPVGLTNPVVNTPIENTVNGDKAYNSDTHLLYVNSNLEMWYRYANETTGEVKIKRVTSSNGVNWNPPETLITVTLDSGDMLSPAIIYEDNKYKVWSNSRGAQGYGVQYRESLDLITWTDNVKLTINFGTYTPWHMDIIKSDDKGYELLVQCKPYGITSNSIKNVLMYTKSLDNVTFDDAIVVLTPSNSYGAFDGYSLYRSSLIRMYDRYYIYYSAISHQGNRGMGLTVGEDITKLKPATLNYFDKVNLPNGSVLKTSDNIVNTLQSSKKVGDTSISIGLQCSLLYLDDPTIGLANGLILRAGAVKYNPTTKFLDVYNGTTWVNSKDGFTKYITAPATVSNYDLTGIGTIIINGTGTVEFGTFINAYVGQTVNIVVVGSGVTGLFKYSATLMTPALVDYSITIAQMGATMVATTTSVLRVIK